MEEIKIKLLLKAIDGTISFIEFIQDGKSKILSYDNIITQGVFHLLSLRHP